MTRYLTLIIFILVTKHTICNFRHGIQQNFEELKRKSKEMYGEVTEEIQFKTEDSLWYSKGDKQKLVTISKLWNDYYECSSRLTVNLTPSQRLPSAIEMVFMGATARLPCGLCVAPDESEVAWFYAESLHNLTFTPIEDEERIVEDCGNITIYHVKLEDAGVYRCQIGDSAGGLVVLEVVNDKNYTVVKPLSSQGPYLSPVEPIREVLTLFSLWTPWSECSVCGRVGRRRRYGICYIRFDDNSKNWTLNVKQNGSTIFTDNRDRRGSLDDETTKILSAFPGGIPCRSRYLPHSVRNIPTVQQRPSEIMIALCKVPCIDIIFEVRSSTGDVLERANNSAGIYSLLQRPPPQPPLPVRNVVFAAKGQPLVLQCPGTTLRDIPVSWRVGAKRVVPRHLDRGSGGRVHLNAQDQLVFATVLYADDNLYSCWQDGNLAGTIKLVVWEGAQAHWNQHTTLLTMVVAGGIVLRVAERVLHNKLRR